MNQIQKLEWTVSDLSLRICYTTTHYIREAVFVMMNRSTFTITTSSRLFQLNEKYIIETNNTPRKHISRQ